MRKIILSGIVSVLFIMGLFVTPTIAQPNQQERASASGHGTLVLPNGQKRQFSFTAQMHRDGTVTGSAVIHNPNFDFRAKLDITCLLVVDVLDSNGRVVGKRASIGGNVRNSNNPNLGENCRGFFTVYDNGEPGRNDTISLVGFSCTTNDPATNDPTPASACRLIGPNDFQQFPIDGGNIQVKGITQ